MGQIVAHFPPPPLPQENRRWPSVSVGEPWEERHPLGAVPSKESLKQGILRPQTPAVQRPVLLLLLLLLLSGDTVSKVPLRALAGGLDSLYVFCALTALPPFLSLWARQT